MHSKIRSGSGAYVLGVLWLAGCFSWLAPTVAGAQNCGAEYTIKEGETLGQIAGRVYGNPSQWTVIFYSNQDRLGSNATLLQPGLSIRLPCIGNSPTAPASPSQTPSLPVAGASSSEQGFLISSIVRRIEFLTADGYAPYTGRALEGGGMLTQVITSSMNLIKQESKGQFDYGISWVNDWSSHLNPLLLTRAFDVGFPWARPNCESPAELEATALYRCQKFFFSDPLFEITTLVFVQNESRIKNLRVEEIAGTTICRPAGYPVQDFDLNGRNWLKDKKIILMRPQSVEECFRLMASGTVDAVAMAELTARSSLASLGMNDRVRALDTPLSLSPLHVIVSKTHPNARTLLYYVNSSLAKLRESGEYDRIVERHLTRYWEAQATPNPAVGATPAVSPKPAPAATPAAKDSPPSAGVDKTTPTTTAKSTP